MTDQNPDDRRSKEAADARQFLSDVRKESEEEQNQAKIRSYP